MHRFPPIHVRKWPFATVSAMGIPGWDTVASPGERRDTTQ